MKYIILVGDGMADFPLAELGGKTPLEAAETPAIDYLATHGQLHTLRTVPEGLPPGSDVANLSLLGYKPEDYYTGRAPLEAASLQVPLGEKDIAYRCNLVTMAYGEEDQATMVDYSAGHISTPEAAAILTTMAQTLNGGGLDFYAGVSYRHLLVVGHEVEDLVTVPPHDHTGTDVSDYWRAYLHNPIFGPMVRRAIDILANHPVNLARIADGKPPANGIWLWGEGRAPILPTLKSRFGITGALISAVDLLKGMAVYAGMEVINVPGATGYLDTNYQGKADAALRALRDHDLVLVHVEAPDEASHQGLIPEKIRAIEDFDSKIVAPIVAGLEGTDFRIAITCDHYTPIVMKTHAAIPVPIAIFDSTAPGKGVGQGYGERGAEAAGSLLADGEEFFAALLNR